MGWKVAVTLFRSIALLGTLVGVIYLPADVYGLQSAIESWGLAMSWLSREIALVIFASFLVAYIIYRDIAPFIRDWIGGQYAAIKIMKRGLSFHGHSVTGDDDERLRIFKVDVYLRIFNHRRSGAALKNVQASVFFLGRRYRCPNIAGQYKSDISHGEIEDFFIGYYFTETIPMYYGNFNLGKDARLIEKSVRNGYQSFYLPAGQDKKESGLGIQKEQKDPWRIAVIVSADGEKARQVIIKIEQKDNDVAVEVEKIKSFN